MNEEKIKEDFRKFAKEHDNIYDDWESFKAGYLAMLNSLEFVGTNKVETLYRLPEGITK